MVKRINLKKLNFIPVFDLKAYQHARFQDLHSIFCRDGTLIWNPSPILPFHHVGMILKFFTGWTKPNPFPIQLIISLLQIV